MKYKIEKNIPIGESPSVTYPFREMEVGDSFVIPLNKRNGCLTSARNFGNQQDPEWKFVTKTIDENKARIWRTK